MDHKWPIDDKIHVFGPWVQQNRSDAKGGPTQYRSCVHPDCPGYEERPAPRG